jgi:hypothetical protein
MKLDWLFKGRNKIIGIPIKDWLDWSAGKVPEKRVALPLIQRGSVWNPAKIIDLWDSLLRGMPVGSFMVNSIPSGTLLRLPGQSKSSELMQEAIGLLDGQQRTMAMLVGWPKSLEMDRRVYVDFADEPGQEHLFRLRVTTKNHPFGFQPNSPSAKLSVDDRRRAELIYKARNEKVRNEIDHDKKIFADFNLSLPYRADKSLPVNIADLIKWFFEEENEEIWASKVEKNLASIDSYRILKGDAGLLTAMLVEPDEKIPLYKSERVQNNLKAFYAALNKMMGLDVPLIYIDIDSVEDPAKIDNSDPPLAILFKRVGANGTPLSSEDYVFSVIKHRYPQTHDLVELLHTPENGSAREYNIAVLLTPTDIVSTAVRLAATNWIGSDGKGVRDAESIDKNQFYRLLRDKVNYVDGREGEMDFLTAEFLPMINGNNPLGMATLLSAAAEILQYRKDRQDIGLPPYALWLLKRPLIQVILFWLYSVGLDKQALDENRNELLRFVLFWSLCVQDGTKASVQAFEIIKNWKLQPSGGSVFKAIYDKLVANNSVALRLYSPDRLKEIIGSVIDTKINENDKKPLRGWSRFAAAEDEGDDVRYARSLYLKWWWRGGSHYHPLLLWLQRNYVATLEGSPVAGREEDTPYDFDHILPQAHWDHWTGAAVGKRIKDCMKDEDQYHSLIGNCIGNLRVWDSSRNRSDGDAPPTDKMRDDSDWSNSLIDQDDHKELWIKCSAGAADKREWGVDRAVAFQDAVEKRAFYLYKRFFDDLKFELWAI